MTLKDHIRLGMIGCGNMGTALLKGIVSKELVKSENIIIYDKDPQKKEALKEELKVAPRESELGVLAKADAVILAVKPQHIFGVLETIREKVRERKPVLISIAAGVSLRQFRAVLGEEVRLVRVMPNTPALVGEGSAALYFDFREEDPALKAFIMELFQSIGLAIEVENEDLLDVVTGLSGSGPAYVITFINALADAAVKEGLDRKRARQLAAQTVFGSAKLILKEALDKNIHPLELRDRVTSPGGTTAAGLFALEEGAFQAAVQKAVSAATARSRELNLLSEGK